MSNEGALNATAISDFFRTGLSHFRFFSMLTKWKRPARQLRLGETLSLGNRGMVAVVKYQQQEFLVGCTNTSIAMLAQLTAGAETSGGHTVEPQGEE